ncbi:MAG: DUF1292 domain-containing protein [Eubacterium sp.]|nr:DUF1292 domain-containing protein [Eubacterium sp.]
MKEFASIPFYTEDGEEIELAVLEQTRINGINYLLVSPVEEEDTYAFLLKECGTEDQLESTYEEIEDEEEMLSVSRIFEQLMEDMDFEVE